MISEASADEVEARAADASRGGMRPKLAGLRRRDPRRRDAAHIIDGRVPHSLLLELFTDAGHRHEDRAARDRDCS